jgi:hypothetical protein
MNPHILNPIPSMPPAKGILDSKFSEFKKSVGHI